MSQYNQTELDLGSVAAMITFSAAHSSNCLLFFPFGGGGGIGGNGEDGLTEAFSQ